MSAKKTAKKAVRKAAGKAPVKRTAKVAKKAAKKAARKVAKKPTKISAKVLAGKAAPTFEEIATAAFLKHLNRQATGIPADPTADWLEAERELRG